MKISKTANTAARRIFRLCQVNGQLDEAKMITVVRRIVESKPRDYRGILAGLTRLVRLDLAGRQVTVESAVALDAVTQDRVASGLKAKYGDRLNFEYRVTPELLGGLKIRVGNDVFDGSVQGRLDRLSRAF